MNEKSYLQEQETDMREVSGASFRRVSSALIRGVPWIEYYEELWVVNDVE